MKKRITFDISFLLFALFLALKLTNKVDWSWIWVTSPLWIPVLLVTSILFLTFILVFILILLKKS
jgi:hypothetical protein